MIDKLTKSQETKLVEFQEEWLKIGLSTAPADRPTTEKVLTKFYRRIGKTAPKFVWCNGVLETQIAINLRANLSDNLRANLSANLRDNLFDNLRANLSANLRANLRDNLSANLFDNLRDNLIANLRDNLFDNLRDNLSANLLDNLFDNLSDNLFDNLRANLSANLFDNLRDNLFDNLSANLSDNLRDNLRDNLFDNLRDNLFDNLFDNKLSFYWTWLWGSLDAYWIAFYLFPHEHVKAIYKPEKMELLNEWAELAKSCFLIWPYEDVCFISERPAAINKDNKRRLHCENGPAMSFRDGWAMWYWHGVSVPQWIIETPEKITPELINAEQNAEVRRVMLERYGWDKMLTAVGAKLINAHPNPKIGELWRWREPDGIDVQVLRVLNGTPDPETGGDKWYSLRVPLDQRTALDANRWTYPLFSHLTDDEFVITADYRA